MKDHIASGLFLVAVSMAMKNRFFSARWFCLLGLLALFGLAVWWCGVWRGGGESVRGSGTDERFVGVRRALRLAGVERKLTAAGEVLSFAGDGTGQAEFTRPADWTDRPCRIWARVRPLGAAGAVRILLTTPEGDEHAAILPGQAERDRWHWLDLGATVASRFRLTGQGDVAWHLQGVALVPDGSAGEVPAPPVPLPGTEVERHFGDSFDRSPGHGMGEWETRTGEWQVEFSFDPNRLPLQYSLLGRPAAAGVEALLETTGPAWLGSRASVAVFPASGAQCGVALVTENSVERYLVQAGEGETGLPRVEPEQWYLLTVEAWGWTRRFSIDGREVAVRHDAVPVPHRPALLVVAGEARFDDVQVASVAWGGEDGLAYRLPWQVATDADWRRLPERGVALLGRRGELVLGTGMPALHEVLLWQDGEARNALGDGNWGLSAPARLERVAVAAAAGSASMFRSGPYTFDGPTIPDPSDYLDFTPEEWEEIRRSPDVDKLARKAKETPVVGRDNQYAIWGTESGRWQVADGVLEAGRRGGRLRFWQELDGAFTLDFRLRIMAGDGLARVIVGEQNGVGIAVVFHGPGAAGTTGDVACPIAVGEWVAARLELARDRVVVRVGEESREKQVVRGVGGGLLLEAEGGGVAFDDVAVAVPRRTAGQWFHGFDRREPDWWREGGPWVDHGGVSCALASSWVSLLAPESRGMLWHKQQFSGDVMLAANVEENTEWIGWQQDPSHIHHPFDNMVLCFGQGQNADSGYRLEVNSRDRTATVLYRQGREVAKVEQDRNFPIQYVGGHAPYRPRRNRLALVREGNRLRAIVNGVEVLVYEDSQPLPTDSVGIGGYRTQANFSRVMVRRLD